MKRFALVFLFALSAVAQPVSVGVLGGVPLVDQTQTYSNPLDHDESRPYIIGPSVEVRLPAGFAIEADGLYQRVGSTFGFQLQNSATFISTGSGITPVNLLTTASTNRARANLWEFPLLGKYYFRRDSTWQPFVGTGFAFRTAGFHEAGTETLLNSDGVTSLLGPRATSDPTWRLEPPLPRAFDTGWDASHFSPNSTTHAGADPIAYCAATKPRSCSASRFEITSTRP